jgi:DNA-binding transcriptional LysR family regulator
MLDARRLRMLAELERLGTIAAVADALQQTPSGISMQLAVLEREAGLALTEREGRRLRLTPAGRLLARHGRELAARLALAETEAGTLRRGAAGRYAIAAFPSAARTYVARLWRGLQREGSEIELRVRTEEPEEALSSLASGHADLAVVHSYSNVPRPFGAGRSVTHLADDPVWLACRTDDPVNRPGGTVRLEDLAGRLWIAGPPELTCHSMVVRACGLAGFQPAISAESVDFAVQLALVAAGAGVALVPGLTADTVPDGVTLRPLARPVTRHIAVAVRNERRGDPAISRLIERLAAAADQHQPGPALVQARDNQA